MHVYDDVDNAATDDVRINVTEAGSNNGFSITNPFQNQTIEKTVDTYAISIEAGNAADFKSLSVTAQNLWTGETLILLETTP